MCELDARQWLEVIAPPVADVRPTYGEEAIQRAFPGVRNADAAIDYGDAWIVEISTRKLTRASSGRGLSTSRANCGIGRQGGTVERDPRCGSASRTSMASLCSV